MEKGKDVTFKPIDDISDLFGRTVMFVIDARRGEMFVAFEDKTFAVISAVEAHDETADLVLVEDDVHLVDYPDAFVRMGLATNKQVEAERERERSGAADRHRANEIRSLKTLVERYPEEADKDLADLIIGGKYNPHEKAMDFDAALREGGS